MTPPPSPLRVGIVPYLNMLPMIAGLEDLTLEGDPGARLEIHADPPSVMTRKLEAGELDIAMAPVGGIFEHPEWRIVGRQMIGSRGEVLSVLLISPDPPERWKVVHPDGHSRTSNALMRLLLARHFKIAPRIGEPVPVDGWEPPEPPPPGEAFLLIGTRALRWRKLWRDRGATAIDLGAAWTEWTGLPFVYAVWAARPGVEAERWMPAFEALESRNRARLDELIAAWPGLNEERLTPAEAHRYLTRHIAFELDEPARAGLRRFYAEGLQLGVFAPGWNLDRALAPPRFASS